MKSIFAKSNLFRTTSYALFMILFFISQTPLKAQDKPEPKLHFGMKIQPALAWLKSDTKGVEGEGTAFRFTYGFITEFKFADRYYFATGVDICNRGGSIRSEVVNPTNTIITESDIKLGYIEIPLSLKLKTNEIGHLAYFLQFGLTPGFNINARADQSTTITNSGGGSSTSSEDKVDISKDINLFNLALNIGIGAEYSLSGTTVLTGGITYSNGFLDVYSDDDVKLNSSYLGLTIGILF